jgi:L-seryl-tRNA(Ser) seleniumtransferase
MSSRSGSDFRRRYLRRLPAVAKLMEHPKLKRVSETCPRVLLVEVIHDVLEARKARILAARDEEQIMGKIPHTPGREDFSFERIVEEVSTLAAEKARMGLRRAINATGDVLSDSLGRAPLNEAAQKALQDVARGYSTLAADIEAGGRCDRDAHVQKLLSMLTGAEAGLVLNNNAAAIMLILNTIADGKEVIISRGQLIENDGFRLPDVIAQSGATMVSVGTTNKTHLRDYRDAIGENTGAILKVHKSNYRIAGFSEDVPIQELVALGREHNIPVIDDIGSGCLVDLTQRGLPEEPPAFLSIRSGADIVCFSGDKLLSGPQAGIVIGGRGYISMMKENPLYRILRVDKLTIAALEATLRLYLDTERILEINPALRLLSRPLEEIEFMARSLMDRLTEKLSDLAIIGIEDGYSRIESVSAAPERFPTRLISIRPTKISADILEKRLRSRAVPIFVPVYDGENPPCPRKKGRLLMDLRSVFDAEVDEIATALEECCRYEFFS